MSGNPLQKFFRQPKVFVKLPSGGAFSKPGTIQGDVNHLPVYGLTGMDEIILKTPDALLSGESTASIISSCVPAIADPWEVSVIDVILILSAIRIATYGNLMHITSTCPSCGEENDYDVDLNRVVEYYMSLSFDNKIVLDNLVVTLQPLTYRKSTEINLKNFKLQQQIAQASVIEDKEKQQEVVNQLFKDLSKTQAEIFLDVIESVDTGDARVTERSYIAEWLTNCEKNIYDAVKQHNQKNNDIWAMPKFPVKCNHCQHESEVSIDLDNSSFFAQA